MASVRFTTRALSLLCLALTGSASPHLHIHRQTGPPSVRTGCYTDNTGGQRALSADSTGTGTMSVQECSAFCRRYQLFGLEYGRECWCGNTLGSQSSQVSDSECSFPCAGNSAQKCGAGNRLDVYENGAYSPRQPAAITGAPYIGCYADSGAPHPLPSNIISTNDMTGAKCAQNCAGFKYFGTEYGQECYCGDTIPATKVSDADCSIPCAGNNDELCGAGQRLTVYERAQNPPTVADFSYHGCHRDSTSQRSLTGPQANRPDMTLETCADLCAQYGWFGVEYGSQCFCGTDLAASAAEPELSDSECDAPCGGNSRELCGAADRLSVYTNAGRANSPPRNKITVVGSGNTTFAYESCWKDLVSARALGDDPTASDDMTVERCAGVCASYAYFGVEYTTQCFCGNVLSGTSAPETECSYVCGGDGKEWCGAAERMNLYRRS